MKVELRQFQQVALAKLRQYCQVATSTYALTQIPQVISFTAPTGAGKTIVLSALLESIFFGDDSYPAKPNSIAIWLSDDPELNAQSREKIETRADKFSYGQCVTISDSDFDQEILDDGKIYFLNTQKLAKTSNLTKHSDSRNYTIWETLRNTIEQKSDRLYFIIDEAHRGAKPGREAGQATTIMQKFIMGDPSVELPKMPVILGMSATVQRFNALIQNVNSSVHRYEVPTDDVRRSGLLKEKIYIAYPEENVANQDMAILQASVDEWMDKWNHWYQYCQEQHYTQVYPILLVQVENGTSGRITNTDLTDCIVKIEARYGKKFADGEIAHAFGSPKTTIPVGNYNIPYVEPSRIADMKNIKVMFFKDTLSTGWDCPRAETMMSFRTATDSTYIAQLLGRMIRTPLGMRVNVDESLNEVKLFLPHFNQDTVEDVVKKLKEIDGGELPTEVVGEPVGGGAVQHLSVNSSVPVIHTTGTGATASQATVTVSNQTSTVAASIQSSQQPANTHSSAIADNVMDQGNAAISSDSIVSTSTPAIPSQETSEHEAVVANTANSTTEEEPSASQPETPEASGNPAVVASTTSDDTTTATFNRINILNYINSVGFANFNVRKAKVNNYFTSLFKLARLLMRSGICTTAFTMQVNAIAEIIKTYIDNLKAEGNYEPLVRKIMEFRMRQNIFDTFGERIENQITGSLFSTTDTDIERQFELAESKLGREGVGMKYGEKYGDPNDDLSFKIDVILFAAEASNLDELQNWAKGRFHALKTKHRMSFVHAENKVREEYEAIVRDGDAVSEFPLYLPYDIQVPTDNDGEVFYNHLYANDRGEAIFKLNTWETAVLNEENANPEFVCWLRNPDRKRWALSIPYKMDNEDKPMYPDFIIVRNTAAHGMVVDVLEPHRANLEDNLPKAKGLAEYAAREQRIGRIQLIRVTDGIGGSKHIHRLDLTDSFIRDKVLHCNTKEELDNLFS